MSDTRDDLGWHLDIPDDDVIVHVRAKTCRCNPTEVTIYPTADAKDPDWRGLAWRHRKVWA